MAEGQPNAAGDKRVVRTRSNTVPGSPVRDQKSLSRLFSPTKKPKFDLPKLPRQSDAPSKSIRKALPLPPQPRAPPASPASLRPLSMKLKGGHRKAHSTSAIYSKWESKGQQYRYVKVSRELSKPVSESSTNAKKELQQPAASSITRRLKITDGSVQPHIITEVRLFPEKDLALDHLLTHPAFRNQEHETPSIPLGSSLSSWPRGASAASQTIPVPSSIYRLPNRPSTSPSHHPTSPTPQIKTVGDFGERFIKECFSADDGYSSTLCSPLDPSDENEEAQTSLRSALTSNSSSNDTATEEQGSMGTKSTSISSIYGGASEKPLLKDILMNGEEAIDMYLAGFTDDIDPENVYPEPTSPTIEDPRSSKGIAEAITKSIGADLLSHVRPFSFGSHKSSAAISGNAFHDGQPTSPPLRTPTATRDQYGFLKKSHQISVAQHDAWSLPYASALEKRTIKWFAYMKDEDLPTHAPFRFPHRCAKTQRFIRKGIPPMWRGAAWFWYAGGDQLLQRDPDLYSTLVSCSELALNANDKEMIERDLHRTFPDNIHFKPDVSAKESSFAPQSEAPLLSSLRRVLRAFALYCPRIGYCQSLNFIAGLLLLFLSEEKSFWMLRIITTEYLPGTHDLSLEGANVDLWILMNAMKQSMPSLWRKVGAGDSSGEHEKNRLPPISLCTTSWFMSLFIGTLPVESVLRVWDVLFYEGSRTIFRTALAIFRLGEQRIKAMSDPMEIFQLVQSLPRGMLDANSLMKVMCRRGGVSDGWVAKRRRDRKRFYAQARAEVAGKPLTEDDDVKLRTSSSILSKADSVWRRKLGRRTSS